MDKSDRLVMKRFVKIVFVFLLLFPWVANAIESSQNLLPLTNENLIAALQNSDYREWAYYQPAARETDANTSSEREMAQRSLYPIVACHRDDVCLIILKKVNAQWIISSVNEKALVRDGLVLKGFSMDENASEVAYSQFVYFNFEDEQGNSLTLNLELSDIYPCYFSAIQRENLSMTLNYERGITIRMDFPFLLRISYEISPEQAIPFGVDAFSLAECPLALEDLLVPAVCSPQEETVGLFGLPDDSKEPIFRLNRGERIEIIRQQHLTDWVLASYNGNLFFVKEGDLSLSHESGVNAQ